MTLGRTENGKRQYRKWVAAVFRVGEECCKGKAGSDENKEKKEQIRV